MCVCPWCGCVPVCVSLVWVCGCPWCRCVRACVCPWCWCVRARVCVRVCAWTRGASTNFNPATKPEATSCASVEQASSLLVNAWFLVSTKAKSRPCTAGTAVCPSVFVSNLQEWLTSLHHQRKITAAYLYGMRNSFQFTANTPQHHITLGLYVSLAPQKYHINTCFISHESSTPGCADRPAEAGSIPGPSEPL